MNEIELIRAIDQLNVKVDKLIEMVEALEKREVKPMDNKQDYYDLSKINDTLLIESNTTVAVHTDEEKGIKLVVRVEGDVNIDYKGENYRSLKDFPEGLINAIKTRNADWKEIVDNDGIRNNNWLEIYTQIRDSQGGYCEVGSDVFEISLPISDENLHKELRDYAKQEYDYYCVNHDLEPER